VLFHTADAIAQNPYGRLPGTNSPNSIKICKYYLKTLVQTVKFRLVVEQGSLKAFLMMDLENNTVRDDWFEKHPPSNLSRRANGFSEFL
jgi:hypothetical protein